MVKGSLREEELKQIMQGPYGQEMAKEMFLAEPPEDKTGFWLP